MCLCKDKLSVNLPGNKNLTCGGSHLSINGISKRTNHWRWLHGPLKIKLVELSKCWHSWGLNIIKKVFLAWRISGSLRRALCPRVLLSRGTDLQQMTLSSSSSAAASNFFWLSARSASRWSKKKRPVAYWPSGGSSTEYLVLKILVSSLTFKDKRDFLGG